MLAGHITLKVFAGFVVLLGTSLGTIGWIGGVVPLALTIAIYALEILVAFLQAYVFAVLTCTYLNDAFIPDIKRTWSELIPYVADENRAGRLFHAHFLGAVV
jgi:hypothetical protein